MSISPLPGPHRKSTLDQAILKLRGVDRNDSPRAWERAAERVAAAFIDSVWSPYRSSHGRGAVERNDLLQVALEACFDALPDWNPAKGAASTYLKFPVRKAIARETVFHSYPVRLPESRQDRKARYEERRELGSIRVDEARFRDLQWRTGCVGANKVDDNESVLDRIPGEDGRDLDRTIDEARRRRNCVRRMMAFRELSFRRTGSRRDWRITKGCILEGRSTHEMGRREGVSHTRVQQILKEVLYRIREDALPKARSERRCAALQRRLSRGV